MLSPKSPEFRYKEVHMTASDDDYILYRDWICNDIEYVQTLAVMVSLPYFFSINNVDFEITFYRFERLADCRVTAKVIDPNQNWQPTEKYRRIDPYYLHDAFSLDQKASTLEARRRTLFGPFATVDELDSVIVALGILMVRKNRLNDLFAKSKVRLRRREQTFRAQPLIQISSLADRSEQPTLVPAKRPGNNYSFFQSVRAGAAAWIGPIGYSGALYITRVDLRFDPVRISDVRPESVRVDSNTTMLVSTPVEIQKFIHTLPSVSGRLMPEEDIPTALASAQSSFFDSMYRKESNKSQAKSLVHEAQNLQVRLRREIGQRKYSYAYLYLAKLQRSLKERKTIYIDDLRSEHISCAHNRC
jgi:hypothetical protein